MTNFEKRKQMSADFERAKQLPEKEFAEWLRKAKEEKSKEPAWCKNRYCEDANGDCKVCLAGWLNEVEKEFELIDFLVKSVGEAQDGYVEATFSTKETALLITALTEKTQREINSINIDEAKE